MRINRRSFVAGAAAGSASSLLATPAISQNADAKVLRFVPQANLSSFDPIWTTATVTNNHGYYVYDTLLGVDMALNPRPQMAESFETSPDGRVWKFKLRAGLKFHDGVPVRAIDCTTSIKRWSARDTFGQLMAKVVDSYVVIDDHTFEIRLKKPFPLLLTALGKADTPAFIMPERHALTDPSKQVTEVIGSGPYKFLKAEYNSGSLAAYEKNADYVSRTEPPSRGAGAKIAHFERIEWRIMPDPATVAGALIKGEVDWWERPAPDLNPLLARHATIAREATDPSGRMAIMRLNVLHPPFDNPEVRKAIRLGVVQGDYMRASQGDDPTVWQNCRNAWGRGTPYFSGEHEDLMPQNADRARAALKASGYGGEKIVIINPTDFPDIGPLGQISNQMLKEIGANVDLLDSDWGTVVQRRTSREPTSKGGWSMFHTTGPVIGWGNPASNLFTRGQGAAGWFGWWKSDKAEDLTQAWLDAPDAPAQTKIAQELGRLVLDEAGTIPLGQFTIKTAYRKSLTGMLPGSAPYPWGLKRV